MRSKTVVVLYEQRKTLADAPPIFHLRIMEAADSHCEGVKLLFDKVSVGVVDLTA